MVQDSHSEHEDQTPPSPEKQTGAEHTGEQIVERSLEEIDAVQAEVTVQFGFEENSQEAIAATDEKLVENFESIQGIEGSENGESAFETLEAVVIESAIEKDAVGIAAAETPLAELSLDEIDSMLSDIEIRLKTDHAQLPSGHEAGLVVDQLMKELSESEPHFADGRGGLEIVYPVTGEQNEQTLETQITDVANHPIEAVSPDEVLDVESAFSDLLSDAMLSHIDDAGGWKQADGSITNCLILEQKNPEGEYVVHIEVLEQSPAETGVVREDALWVAQKMSEIVHGDTPAELHMIQTRNRISVQLGGKDGDAWTYFKYADGSVRRTNHPSDVLGLQGEGSLFKIAKYYEEQSDLGTSDVQVSVAELQQLRALMENPQLYATDDTYTNLITPGFKSNRHRP